MKNGKFEIGDEVESKGFAIECQSLTEFRKVFHLVFDLGLVEKRGNYLDNFDFWVEDYQCGDKCLMFSEYLFRSDKKWYLNNGYKIIQAKDWLAEQDAKKLIKEFDTEAEDVGKCFFPKYFHSDLLDSLSLYEYLKINKEIYSQYLGENKEEQKEKKEICGRSYNYIVIDDVLTEEKFKDIAEKQKKVYNNLLKKQEEKVMLTELKKPEGALEIQACKEAKDERIRIIIEQKKAIYQATFDEFINRKSDEIRLLKELKELKKINKEVQEKLGITPQELKKYF